MISTVVLIAGLLLLYIGAEWFVKGAAGLGRSVGVRPLVIGLTAVAYGTSMPELVVSTFAALDGHSVIALGNVVGSNIANIGLVLGAAAAVMPLKVEGRLIRRELPVLMATAVTVPLLLATGGVGRVEGLALLAGAAAFTVMAAWLTPPNPANAAALMEADAEAAGAPGGTGRTRLIGIGVVGLVLLLAGGQIFVRGATSLAAQLGVSDRVIGLTVVAIGTSAPELATSVIAALRGHAGIAVGNVIGSNIFNVLFVLGGAASVQPIAASLRAFRFDVLILVLMTCVLVALARKRRTIARAEGFALLAAYAIYIVVLLRV